MRGRSSRRKSPWNLLLAPAFVAWFATIAIGILRGLEAFYDVPPIAGSSFAGLMVFAGIAIATMLPAFVLANLTVWLIPGARRAMDREAADHDGASFRDSTLGLLRGSLVTVPLGLILAVAGVLLA